MKREIWKETYLPGVEVSNLGNVKKNGKLYDVHVYEVKGYRRKMFSPRVNKKKVTVYVHRLIAQTFLGDVRGMDVHHKDVNSLNNALSNLVIMTKKEHGKLHMGACKRAAKLNEVIVQKIRQLYATGLWTQKRIGLKFSVRQQTVSWVTQGKTWK